MPAVLGVVLVAVGGALIVFGVTLHLFGGRVGSMRLCAPPTPGDLCAVSIGFRDLVDSTDGRCVIAGALAAVTGLIVLWRSRRTADRRVSRAGL